MKALAASCLTSLLLFTSTAQAYICSRVPDADGNETGASLSWFQRSLTYALHVDGTTDISGTGEFDDLRASFNTWESHLLESSMGCDSENFATDLEFFEASDLSSSTRIGYNFLSAEDNENLLLFRDTAWPHPGQGGIVIALTTNTYNALTGEIFDADIEFNSMSFHFTSEINSSIDTDLINTAVHEIGHFLGLGHTGIQLATMYERAETGETSKRDLFCDDIDAIEFKYPPGQTNGYCDTTQASCGYCAPPGTLTSVVQIEVNHTTPDSTAGCATFPPGAPWLPLITVGFLYRFRRRRLEVLRNLIKIQVR